MSVDKESKRLGYTLVYKEEFQLSPNYYIREDEYFEYYQNANDPILENYNFGSTLRLVTTYEVSYYNTALAVIKAGNKLSILTWQDFLKFISEWLLIKRRGTCQTSFHKNEGINLITIDKDKSIGEIKCIWISKKHAPHRPVGVKVVRELAYLISNSGASKGIIITTSKLTKGALELIDQNRYIMSFIDNEMLEKELKDILSGNSSLSDLQF